MPCRAAESIPGWSGRRGCWGVSASSLSGDNSSYNFALLTNDKCVDVAAGGKVCVIQERWRAGILWLGTKPPPTAAWLPISGLSR